MRAIQFIDEKGQPVTDPRRVEQLLHEAHPRCMSPFFGLYVAVGVVAAAALVGLLVAKVLQ